MIAALYKSRIQKAGSNHFQQGKKTTAFGWEVIEDLLKRELNRAKTNQLCRVPGLKENYVYRDSWTRLNVKPAKIMQVGESKISKYNIIYILHASMYLYIILICSKNMSSVNLRNVYKIQTPQMQFKFKKLFCFSRHVT